MSDDQRAHPRIPLRFKVKVRHGEGIPVQFIG